MRNANHPIEDADSKPSDPSSQSDQAPSAEHLISEVNQAMSSISENLSSIQNQLEIALERTTPSTHNVPSNPSSLQISDHAQHAALQEQRQMEAIQRQIRLEQILQSSDNHHILELPTDHEYFRTVGSRNRNIDAPEPRPGELLPPISQNERSRRNHLRLLSNRLAMHQLLSEDSLLSQNTHDPLCCCSLTAIVSDKKRYQHSLNILLALWYSLTLVISPIMILAYGLHSQCGTNASLVHGIGDGSDTLRLWLAYMILLTFLDTPRIPLQNWSTRVLSNIDVSESVLTNPQLSRRFHFRRSAALFIKRGLQTAYTFLWILITLWTMAGTVWLAASTCTTTNPQLFLYVFGNVICCWIVGVSWYTLSRWRSWYKQMEQLRARRESMLRGIVDGVDIGPLVAAELYAREGVPRNGGEFTRRTRDSREDLDPVLLAMMNSAASDFWQPVDPAALRTAAGEVGVKQEEWDQMRVYVYEGRGEEKVKEIDPEGEIPRAADVPEALEPSIANERECVICFSGYEAGEIVRQLHCGHEFHDECISKWMKSRNEGGQGKRTCPLCVSEVHV